MAFLLPNELYSEILSHWQAIPIPQSAYLDVTIDPRRHLTLLALSQTCRSLRSFFLQYAWERIEVYEGMCTPTGRLATRFELLTHASSPDTKRGPLHAKFETEIRHQFETVTVRNPELRQYVHFVNIVFVNWSQLTIMIPQLAKILSLLPHVHTLQINPAECYPPLPGVNFLQFEYPQIHTLCVRGPNHIVDDLLRVCPNLTSFTQPGIVLLGPLFRLYSSSLHTIGILTSPIQWSLQELATSFPNLRDITMSRLTIELHEDDLSPLSSLPLHTLRLCFTIVTQSFKKIRVSPIESPADRERWIGLAKKTLPKCPPIHGSEEDVQKRVIVITNRSLVQSYAV